MMELGLKVDRVVWEVTCFSPAHLRQVKIPNVAIQLKHNASEFMADHRTFGDK